MTNKLLNTGALLFFAIIMLAVIISKFSSGHYGSANADVMEISTSDDFIMDYAELSATTQDMGDIQFIDLRSEEAFSNGHIPGAINVPVKDLLEKEHRGVFKSDHTKVLYSDQEMLTVHAAMLLLGKGYSVIRILPGSFDIIEEHILTDSPDAAYMYYRDDKARFNYNRFMQSGAGAAATDTESQVPAVPEVKTVQTSIQGGC